MIETVTFGICSVAFGVTASMMLRDDSAVARALGMGVAVLSAGSLAMFAWGLTGWKTP